MSLCAHAQPQDDPAPVLVATEETDAQDCAAATLPPAGLVRLASYRFANETNREYAPTCDSHTSLTKGKFVSKLNVLSAISPPRAQILELLRPEDPGKDALEAIVRSTPRRGLVRPYDDDTKRFLQRALVTNGFSQSSAPENTSRLSAALEDSDEESESGRKPNSGRSLADELKEAEEDELSGANLRRELLREFRKRGGGIREAMERDRLGKLALSVEDDEELGDCGLSAAARRLDALLVESRSLHEELAGIHEDIQMQSVRAGRCAAAARALTAESLALRYLDDVVALLRGDVSAAQRTRLWPFAFGCRQPDRNYIV